MLYFMFFELLLVSLVMWSSVHCADRLVKRKVLIHQSPVVLFERDIIRKLLNAISISYKLYDKRCFHIYPRFWKQFNVALLDCV